MVFDLPEKKVANGVLKQAPNDSLTNVSIELWKLGFTMDKKCGGTLVVTAHTDIRLTPNVCADGTT
jgi:hypothetical protein